MPAKLKQTEMPGMPERDEVASAAAKVVELQKSIKALNFEKGEALDELRDAMIRGKRTSVSIDGATFVLETKEAEDKVRAIWPK